MLFSFRSIAAKRKCNTLRRAPYTSAVQLSFRLRCERLEDRRLLSIQAVSIPALGNGDSTTTKSIRSVSSDGAFVAFYSKATNFVPSDTNNTGDIFVRDTQSGSISRVSVGDQGQGNLDSSVASISSDGRFVAFASIANNLTPGDVDPNANHNDIYVRDIQLGITTLVSTGYAGIGNQSSYYPTISDNGRFVAFESGATNLVANDTGDHGDVFLRDLQSGETTLVSTGIHGQGDFGSSSPSISADGRYIAFYSPSGNLLSGVTGHVSDTFLRDLQASTTTLVSSVNGGPGNAGSGNPSVSANGRYVAFESYASNMIPGDSNGAPDVYVADMQTGTIQLVSTGSGGQGNSDSLGPSISADGRYVAFYSLSDNLVTGDVNGAADVFVRDLLKGTTTLVSTGSDGLGNGASNNPSISADGRHVAFTSVANNLIAGDTNGKSDVFLWTNDAPFAASQNIYISQNTARQITLSAIDPDDLPLNYSVTVFPQHGILTGTAPNLVYTPFANYLGSDSFVFTASNGQVGSENASVSISVIDPLPSIVTATSLTGIGGLPLTTTSLQIMFSKAVAQANKTDNYQLQSTGADGRLGTSDDVAIPITSVKYGNSTATLSFAPLIAGIYRLTVKDAITDLAGKPLDGDGDGQAEGIYTSDFIVTAALTGSGRLDSTFGTNGKVTTSINGVSDSARGVAVQPDGKIVAVGNSSVSGSNDFALVRYNADGSLDTSFGSGGKVTTPVGSGADQANAVALQPDGKILAFGTSNNGSNNDFALLRYNPDGSLDTSFGLGGKVTTPIGMGSDNGTAIVLQPDGKIVAVGYAIIGNDDFAVVRYKPDGSLDTGFGTGGKVTTHFTGADQARAVQLLPDGRIVVAGSAVAGNAPHFALACYRSDGSLDPGFGVGGKRTFSIGAYSDSARGIVAQPDGKLVVVGSSKDSMSVNPSDDKFALARITPDGSLDASFGIGGKVTTPFGPYQANASAVGLQPDGRIVVAGTVVSEGRAAFGVMRYNADGTLDNEFGTGGKTATLIGKLDQVLALSIQPNGHVIVCGSTLTSFTAGHTDFAVVRYTAPLVPAQVVGQSVFYNNSGLDSFEVGPSSSDDFAIAPDKAALHPGQVATFVNYTSYSRGINGVMLDVVGLPATALTTNDFLFRFGNDNEPRTLAISPASISVRPGAGVGSSDRVTLVWPDGAIKNTWLEVTVLATDATGLAMPYVFYFGNAVGESGDSPGNALVNATDEIGARTHGKTFLDPATIDNVYDFNRDGLVNATDQIIARSNATTLATALKLITVPGNLAALSSAVPPLRSDDENTTLHEAIALGLAAPSPLQSKNMATTVSEPPVSGERLDATPLDASVDASPAIQAAADRSVNRYVADEQFDTDGELFDSIADDLLASRV